jgi:hypothetical protein
MYIRALEGALKRQGDDARNDARTRSRALVIDEERRLGSRTEGRHCTTRSKWHSMFHRAHETAQKLVFQSIFPTTLDIPESRLRDYYTTNE